MCSTFNTHTTEKAKRFHVPMAIIVGILVVLVALAVGGIGVYQASPRVKVRKQIDLGDRYLAELNYEEAVAAFTVALEIDPQNEEVTEKLSDALEGWARVLISSTDYAQVQELISRLKLLAPDRAALIEKELYSKINEEQAMIWLSSANISFSVDQIILGESDIGAAKASYAGRADYKSNPMNDDAYDTVYSMPYMNGGDAGGKYDEMTFGYLFSAPNDGGAIDDMWVTDPSLLCFGGVHIGESEDETLNYFGLNDLLDDNGDQIDVSADGRELFYESNSCFKYKEGDKSLCINFRDHQVYSINCKLEKEGLEYE